MKQVHPPPILAKIAVVLTSGGSRAYIISPRHQCKWKESTVSYAQVPQQSSETRSLLYFDSAWSAENDPFWTIKKSHGLLGHLCRLRQFATCRKPPVSALRNLYTETATQHTCNIIGRELPSITIYQITPTDQLPGSKVTPSRDQTRIPAKSFSCKKLVMPAIGLLEFPDICV